MFRIAAMLAGMARARLSVRCPGRVFWVLCGAGSSMGRVFNIFVNFVKKFARLVGLAGGNGATQGTIGSADYGRPGLGSDCEVHPGGTRKLAFPGCGVPIILVRAVGL